VKLPADPVLSGHMGAPTTHDAEEEKKQQQGPPRGLFELNTSLAEGKEVETVEAQQQAPHRSSRDSDRQSGRWFPWWHRQSSAGVPRDRRGGGSGRGGGDGSEELSPGVSARSHSAKERDEQPNFAAAWMALGVNKDG